MITNYKNTLVLFSTVLTMGVVFSKCTKPELDDAFPKGDPPPVAGGFVNSSEIATANLVAHFPRK